MTLHNSRTSQRMKKLKIYKGQALRLSLEIEIELTKVIGSIISDNQYNCLAYNICKDHVHIILVCTPDELSKQVQRIKAVSSRLIKPFINKENTTSEHVPLEATHIKKGRSYTPFWSQKFFHANLDVWSLGSFSNRPGYIYTDSYLSRAMHYIRYNREKHKLPHSNELQNVIDRLLVDIDTAFEIENL